MSGWIKVEKDLLTDPRVVRLGLMLQESFGLAPTEAADENCGEIAAHARNGLALPGVTLVLGALCYLWFLADTHIEEDDTIPLGTYEIDKLLGLPGFCDELPSDWLQVVDHHRVKLPGYHLHNGIEARAKLLNAARQARFRSKRNGTALHPRNARNALDRDLDHHLDQDLIKKDISAAALDKRNAKNGTSLPPDLGAILTPDVREWSARAVPAVDVDAALEEFCDYWRAVPGRKGRKTDWPATFRNRLRELQGRAASKRNGAAQHDDPVQRWRPPDDEPELLPPGESYAEG